MYCNKCGYKLAPGDRFCRGCGRQVEPDNSAPASPVTINPVTPMNYTAQPPQQLPGDAPKVRKKHTTGIIIGISGVLALVVAGVILFSTVFAPKPVDIVNKCVKAVNDMDIKAALSCVDPRYETIANGMNNVVSTFTGIDAFSMASMLPFFSEFAGSDMGSIKDFKVSVNSILSNEEDGDNASVRASLKVSASTANSGINSQNLEVTFVLKKFAGKGWRIVNLIE